VAATEISALKSFQNLLLGSNPGGGHAVCAVKSKVSGIVSTRVMGESTLITVAPINGDAPYCDKLPTALVSVKNGMYVEAGMPLTLGWPEVPVLRDISDLDKVQNLQIDWLTNYVNTFGQVKIKVKNFEVLVRAQTSLVNVVTSDNDEVVPGKVHSLAFVQEKIQAGSDISVIYAPAKQQEVIKAYSGEATLVCFESALEWIGDIVGSTMRSNSFLGDIFTGKTIGAKDMNLNIQSFEVKSTAKKPSVKKDVVVNNALSSDELDNVLSYMFAEPSIPEEEPVYVEPVVEKVVEPEPVKKVVEPVVIPVPTPVPVNVVKVESDTSIKIEPIRAKKPEETIIFAEPIEHKVAEEVISSDDSEEDWDEIAAKQVQIERALSKADKRKTKKSSKLKTIKKSEFSDDWE
jgi:hypothetical protein